MKSKKPFLIVCAAALTLALSLPFMGVFAFAEDSFTVSCENQMSYDVNFYISFDTNNLVLRDNSWSSVFSRPDSLTFYVACNKWDNSAHCYLSCDLDGVNLSLSTDSDSPVILPDSFSSLSFTAYIAGASSSVRYYFSFPVPPDPLAPVSDGLDTMISVFGDVIDYIINTPHVAIFVAISVAGCAIIPMGIILIKKLIKGY